MYSNDKQGLWHAWLSVTLMALSQWPGALRSRARGLWLRIALPLMLGCALLGATSAASAATETVTYIHTDVSGSPLAATDSNGAVVWKESYRAYGERWLQQSGTGQQTQWFHGKEQDAGTGLQYFGARYYDPEVGRFLGVDPVDFQEGNLHSFNRFAYGNNNPVKYKDPDGGYAEAAVEALSLAIGIDSFRQNFNAGNRLAATVDGLGVAADVILTALPGIPGVAGLGIKSLREGGELAAKRSGTFTEISIEAKATRNSAHQLNVGSTQAQAIENLASNGYAKTMSKDGTVTIMISGDKTYRFYPQSTGGGVAGAKSGVPSASVSINDNIVAKLRFVGE